MSDTNSEIRPPQSTRSLIKVGFLTIPLLASVWPFVRFLSISGDHPSARLSVWLVGLAILVAVGRLAWDRFLYEDVPEDASRKNTLERYLPETWAVISLSFVVASTMNPLLGLAALAAAVAGIGSEFFRNEGRMRPLLWFVCLTFPIVFFLPTWQSIFQYSYRLTAWIASGLLDVAAVPNLLVNDTINTGSQTIFQVASQFAHWNGLETYLAICLAACIIFRRSLLTLGLSLLCTFYWCIAIQGCRTALNIMALESIDTVFGLSISMFGWMVLILGIVGVVLLEQFVAALCGPIYFNTLDTPLPMIPQALNRILTFPETVHQMIQSRAPDRVSEREIEYEEISLSSLSATTKRIDSGPIEVVRFEEVLQRNKRAADDEREQA